MRFVTAMLLPLGIAFFAVSATAQADHKTLKREVHREITQAMKYNAQARRQILKDARAARLSPAAQRDIRRSLQRDAQLERQHHREIHRNLNQIPAGHLHNHRAAALTPYRTPRTLTGPATGIHHHDHGRHLPPPPAPNCGNRGVTITPQGIGFSVNGFNIFLRR